MTAPKDWRGVEITEGALLIYGAGVGRSVALVEATFTGRVTDSGRLWVRIVRRAYGGGWSSAKPEVHIGADRVTVVGSLPPSGVPLEDANVLDSVNNSIKFYTRELAESLQRGHPRRPDYSWTHEEEVAHYETELAKMLLKRKELTDG